MPENNAQVRPESNAQVRSPHLRRNDPDVRANDVRRVLADPAVLREFDQMEREIIEQICVAPNGRPEDDERERELCRTLRTIKRLRGGLSMTPQLDELRANEFQSSAPDETENAEAPAPYQPGIQKTERFP